jgi:hypothetical protein
MMDAGYGKIGHQTTLPVCFFPHKTFRRMHWLARSLLCFTFFFILHLPYITFTTCRFYSFERKWFLGGFCFLWLWEGLDIDRMIGVGVCLVDLLG